MIPSRVPTNGRAVMAGAGGEDAGGDQPDPRARLMEEVAAQMDAIEADFGDGYEIGAIVTVVEVRRPDAADVRVRCNAPPRIGLGMLHVAEKVLEAQAGGQRAGDQSSRSPASRAASSLRRPSSSSLKDPSSAASSSRARSWSSALTRTSRAPEGPHSGPPIVRWMIAWMPAPRRRSQTISASASLLTVLTSWRSSDIVPEATASPSRGPAGSRRRGDGGALEMFSPRSLTRSAPAGRIA